MSDSIDHMIIPKAKVLHANGDIEIRPGISQQSSLVYTNIDDPRCYWTQAALVAVAESYGELHRPKYTRVTINANSQHEVRKELIRDMPLDLIVGFTSFVPPMNSEQQTKQSYFVICHPDSFGSRDIANIAGFVSQFYDPNNGNNSRNLENIGRALYTPVNGLQDPRFNILSPEGGQYPQTIIIGHALPSSRQQFSDTVGKNIWMQIQKGVISLYESKSVSKRPL